MISALKYLLSALFDAEREGHRRARWMRGAKKEWISKLSHETRVLSLDARLTLKTGRRSTHF